MHRDLDRSLTGKIGRVTGAVGPDTLGEVMLEIRGGTTAYPARPYDGSSVYPMGERVLVMYLEPPQTVYVASLPEFLQHRQ
ncbi:hypothetical protein SAMN04489740_0486 [Arthrobacter alpinus]|uniref:Uncharacterized protein n=1 Tax=Arthrobacter alpinus TaxID=656366 RepID=A0A1H5FDS8_9MICC|nr:hypothetical protein [Arthrobacter alpinus]SEE01519.1 hypothetical protein SAMN04489740_0486 [Arthrobacter alpinus]